MLSGLPVIRSWLISSRPTSLLLSGEPVCHLALGCAVLRRGMAREEKGPRCFLSPWGLLGQHFFAPTAAFLLVASAESVFSFLGLQDQYHGTLCSDGTEPKSPLHMVFPHVRPHPVYPRKFWLTSPHPCQWLVNNFIPTYKFFILSLMLKFLC